MQLLIGKDWTDGSDGRTYDNRNPATGASLGAVAEASATDVDAAVRSARAAFDGGKWPSMPPARRAKILYKMAQLISERANDLALLEVRDNGKALSTARGELGAIVECFEFYAGAATKNYGETIPGPISSYLTYTLREPLGASESIATPT